MGRLIEQQAVTDCLTNTAKYYEREDADEWTKGIHYGLLHGLDNILDNVKPVDVYTKDEVITMLAELQDELKYTNLSGLWKTNYAEGFNDSVATSVKKIQCRINKLRGNK